MRQRPHEPGRQHDDRIRTETTQWKALRDQKGVIIRSVPVFILAGLVVSVAAQEVSLPDPGLNAAVRDTLQKPVGPLTQGDLLSPDKLERAQSKYAKHRRLGSSPESERLLLLIVLCGDATPIHCNSLQEWCARQDSNL